MGNFDVSTTSGPGGSVPWERALHEAEGLGIPAGGQLRRRGDEKLRPAEPGQGTGPRLLLPTLLL